MYISRSKFILNNACYQGVKKKHVQVGHGSHEDHIGKVGHQLMQVHFKKNIFWRRTPKSQKKYIVGPKIDTCRKMSY